MTADTGKQRQSVPLPASNLNTAQSTRELVITAIQLFEETSYAGQSLLSIARAVVLVTHRM